ncbi:MAG: nuclear transport factor 2 family protein [Dokdonella sp.]
MTLNRSLKNIGACLLIAMLAATTTGCATTAPRIDSTIAVAQVTNAERAFARSMAERNFAAFAAHVDDEALFFSGNNVLRGKAAVLAGWKASFDGPAPPFAWQPEQVEVLASGDLALSTGPVLDATGKRVASFQSIWRRQPSGNWKVIFDRGCPCSK